ncbi:hypothetical protein [Tropicimonas sp. S265A]|uniref:hypothetical protein n=1 Tax=Tropicimonas sp. S265A TaxID=3415134 RepID=UPI003C79CA35
MSRLLSVAFIAMLLVFVQHFGGVVEGYLKPVVTPANLTRIEPAESRWSLIWSNSERLRDCSFEGIEWRIGEPGASSLIDLVFLERSKVRPSGVFDFGPWKLHATREQIEERSFAIVRHRCHFLWLTKTTFY